VGREVFYKTNCGEHRGQEGGETKAGKGQVDRGGDIGAHGVQASPEPGPVGSGAAMFTFVNMNVSAQSWRQWDGQRS
jgi:hypothetical protein